MRQQISVPANGREIPTNAEVAQKIADDLFGDCDRLVLSKGDEDSGRAGWSKQVVTERITKRLP